MCQIKAFRARFSWSLSAIKMRMEIVIYKRKASSVQYKLNKDSSPTPIRVGMFFKNLYHRAENNSGTLDWIDFKLTVFCLAVWTLGTKKKIDQFLKNKQTNKTLWRDQIRMTTTAISANTNIIQRLEPISWGWMGLWEQWLLLQGLQVSFRSDQETCAEKTGTNFKETISKANLGQVYSVSKSTRHRNRMTCEGLQSLHQLTALPNCHHEQTEEFS